MIRREHSVLVVSLVLIGVALLILVGCGKSPTETPASTTPATTTPPTTTPTTPAPTIKTVLLWEREGGIAGFCDGLSVTEDGQAQATSCQSGGGEDRGSVALSPEEKNQLDAWVLQYVSFDKEIKDDATADGMTTRIQLFGAGDQEATDAEVQEIVAFAESVYTEATNLSPGTEEAASTSEMIAAYQAAVAYLATQLGIEQTSIVKTAETAEDWPDTCLGLGSAGELCAEAVTPGYRFLVRVVGQSYEIRTNSDASVIRYQTSP
jgi:hypothetical protein